MANVSPQAYREMITSLEKFNKDMKSDVDFLAKSANLLYQAMQQDTISSRLKLRIERSTKEIGELCTSVENFKKDLEEELEMIMNALKKDNND